MPQSRSSTRRLAALVVALATTATLFVASAGPVQAAAPVDAPTIIGPDGTTEGSNPILQWEPLTAVTKYRVQVSASSSFSSTLWTADASNVSATPPTDLPLGTLYWRVAGMDGTSVGPYATASFTRTRVAGPQPLAPADGATLEYPSEPVILRWEAVPGVKNYKVEYDDAADFIGAKSAVTDATNWALLETQPLGQTFYWRVQGQGSTTGVNTEFSPTWQYDLEWSSGGTPSVPTLTQPAAGASITDVVFRWNAITGAARYQIQVSPNGDWANNVTVDQLVKGTSFSPPVTLNNASYFWRVRALSVRNPADAGPWSPDGRQFTRAWADTPTLESPDDGEVEAEEYLLRWDPVPFASGYELQVGTDANFSPGTFRTCTTVHTDWSPYWRLSTVDDPAFPTRAGTCPLADDSANRRTYLRQGVRYHWRVRGVDLSDLQGTVPSALGRFSDTHDFIYLPGVPTGLTPTAGSTVQVPKLSWEAVPGVERYEVSVSLDNDLELTTSVHGTSYVPPIALAEDEDDNPLPGAITWTVRAIQFQGSGATGGSGPVITGPPFTLSPGETGAGPSPTLTAPASDAQAVHPEFDWTPVTGAHHYRVVLYPAGSSVGTELIDPDESGTRRFPWRSAFTPIVPISPGDYEWQVKAYTETSVLMSSSALRPITIEPLELATLTAPANCVEGSACTVHPATPLLQWNPVPWAAFYRVHLALDGDFTNVRHIYTTTQASLRPYEALPDNQAGQSYHWFVQPCRTTAVCGRFDSTVFDTARAFRKASRPIALLSPAHEARVADQVTFSWGSLSSQWVASDDDDDLEAEYYKIEISTRSDFTSLLETAKVDQTTYTPYLKTYPEGPIYWRVQAYDSSNNPLTSSTTRVVHKSAPLIEVTSPSDGDEVNIAPVVQWDAQPFAAGYQVEYYKNGDTSWTLSNRVQTTSTQLAADTMLKALPPGTYAYRVRRVDVDGLFGPWSSDPPPPSTNPADGDRRTFEVVGGEPSPTGPANGTVFSRPRIRLEWEPVVGATSYRVETSASAGFGTLVENQVTVMTAWSLVKTYTNGTIYWRVRAIDAQGNVIGTSATRTFVHDLSRPTATITKGIAGPASALVQWTAQAGGASGPITSFVVTPYLGAVKGTPVTVGSAAREVRMTGLDNDKSYKFTVTPYDANGVGIESSQSASVTPRAVAPFTSIDRFIDRQFQDFYGRRPTGDELTQVRAQMQGGTSPQTVINSLWNNAAHANVMPQLTRLYSAFYVRIPDYGGLSFWAGERRKGVTLASIATTFAKTPEFTALYGQVSNAGFVDLVYDNVLGRPASSGDRTYWTNELNAGRRTRGTLMIGFSEAAEYKTKFQHDINAALIYMEMLRRKPTTAERDTLSASLKGGQSLPATFVKFLALPEYANRAT
jgi:hypothetical protein